MPRCNVCGEIYDDGDYRCDGELPDGTRCGADLIDQSDSSASRGVAGGGR
jgi:hypothetical protein